MAKNHPSFFRGYLLPFLIILLCVVAVYEPVLTHCYAHTDDYPGIYGYNYFPGGPFEKVWQANGRPIMGMEIWLLFREITQPEELWKVRAVGLAGISICGLTLFRLYRSRKWQTGEAAAVSMLVILTPAFGVYAGWATTSTVPFAVMLALMAGWAALLGTENPRSRAGAGWLILGVLGAWLSECSYQPAAGFFLLPALVEATRSGFSASDLRKLRRCTVIFVGVLATYYLAYQLYAKLFLHDNVVVERGGLCPDVLERLRFFIEQPGTRLLMVWGAFSQPLWQWVIGIPVFCLAGTGMADYVRRCEKSDRLWATLLPLICFLLIVSPLLVAKESYAPFRTLAAAYALVLHFAALGLRTVGVHINQAQGNKTTLTLIWLTVVVASGIAARYWVWRGLVTPNEKELAKYRHYLNRTAATFPKRIFFSYPTMPPKALYGMEQIEEYGTYSSWLEWVPKPMLTMLLCEEFGEAGKKTVRADPDRPPVIIFRGEAAGAGKNDLVIDGTSVLSGSPPLR